MPTENPKISAYVPPIIYDRFKKFQEERKLSMSQAAIELFAEYFGIDLLSASPQITSGGLLSRIQELERVVSDLKQSYIYLSNKLELFNGIHKPLSPNDSLNQGGTILYNPDNSIDCIPDGSILSSSPNSAISNTDNFIADGSLPSEPQANDQQLNGDNSLIHEIVDQNISTSELPNIKTDNLDKTSNSKAKSKADKSNLQLELLSKLEQKNIDKLEPLNSTQLSKRFNKADGFVKSKKFYYKDRPEEFLIFLKQNDPQGIGWKYSEDDKKYHPVLKE